MLSPLAKGYGSWMGEIDLCNTRENTNDSFPAVGYPDPHRHGVTVTPRGPLSTPTTAPSSRSIRFENLDGKLDLPKTFLTRKGALLLFTAPDDVEKPQVLSKQGFQRTQKGKRLIDLSLRIGTLDRLCQSVLQYGDQDFDRENSSVTDPKNKYFLRFIRQTAGLEDSDFDLHSQPGGDLGFYLRDLKSRASSRHYSAGGDVGSNSKSPELREILRDLEGVIHQRNRRTRSRGSGDFTSSSRGSPKQRVLSSKKLTASLKSSTYLGRPTSALSSPGLDDFEETSVNLPRIPSRSSGRSRSSTKSGLWVQDEDLGQGDRGSKTGSVKLLSRRTATPDVSEDVVANDEAVDVEATSAAEEQEILLPSDAEEEVDMEAELEVWPDTLDDQTRELAGKEKAFTDPVVPSDTEERDIGGDLSLFEKQEDDRRGENEKQQDVPGSDAQLDFTSPAEQQIVAELESDHAGIQEVHIITRTASKSPKHSTIPSRSSRHSRSSHHSHTDLSRGEGMTSTRALSGGSSGAAVDDGGLKDDDDDGPDVDALLAATALALQSEEIDLCEDDEGRKSQELKSNDNKTEEQIVDTGEETQDVLPLADTDQQEMLMNETPQLGADATLEEADVKTAETLSNGEEVTLVSDEEGRVSQSKSSSRSGSKMATVADASLVRIESATGRPIDDGPTDIEDTRKVPDSEMTGTEYLQENKTPDFKSASDRRSKRSSATILEPELVSRDEKPEASVVDATEDSRSGEEGDERTEEAQSAKEDQTEYITGDKPSKDSDEAVKQESDIQGEVSSDAQMQDEDLQIAEVRGEGVGDVEIKPETYTPPQYSDSDSSTDVPLEEELNGPRVGTESKEQEQQQEHVDELQPEDALAAVPEGEAEDDAGEGDMKDQDVDEGLGQVGGTWSPTASLGDRRSPDKDKAKVTFDENVVTQTIPKPGVQKKASPEKGKSMTKPPSRTRAPVKGGNQNVKQKSFVKALDITSVQPEEVTQEVSETVIEETIPEKKIRKKLAPARHVETKSDKTRSSVLPEHIQDLLNRRSESQSQEELEMEIVQMKQAIESTLGGPTLAVDGEEGLTAEELILAQEVLLERLREAEMKFDHVTKKTPMEAPQPVKKPPVGKSKKKKKGDTDSGQEKRDLQKERAAIWEQRKREKLERLEEARQLQEKIKARAAERSAKEEDAKRRATELAEEIEELQRQEREIQEAEEDARHQVALARKSQRDARDKRRKEELERKKQEAIRRREKEKEMIRAAREKEADMLQRIADNEIKRNLQEEDKVKREEEERVAQERYEEELILAQREAEEEELRMRELEKEAEEEAMQRLVEEREESERRRWKLKELARQMEEEEEKKRQLMLEEERRLEEEKRQKELEEERKLEEEKERLVQLQRLEEEARETMRQELERRRSWALQRRDVNLERRVNLDHVRQSQGITRPWVFSYFQDWPRDSYNKLMGHDSKSKQAFRRPPAKPKQDETPAKPQETTLVMETIQEGDLTPDLQTTANG